jgi:O-antigen/teichoic acid export membrane protein
VIRQNIDPVVGKAFARDRLDEIEECGRMIRRKFFPKMLLAGTGLAIGFPILLYLLNHFFGREANFDSYYVLIILVVCYAAASIYQPFIGLLLQGGRPGIFTMVIVLSVIGNILLNMLLIPEVGIFGAAIGTGVMAIVQGLGIVFLGRHLFRIKL